MDSVCKACSKCQAVFSVLSISGFPSFTALLQRRCNDDHSRNKELNSERLSNLFGIINSYMLEQVYVCICYHFKLIFLVIMIYCASVLHFIA